MFYNSYTYRRVPDDDGKDAKDERSGSAIRASVPPVPQRRQAEAPNAFPAGDSVSAKDSDNAEPRNADTYREAAAPQPDNANLFPDNAMQPDVYRDTPAMRPEPECEPFAQVMQNGEEFVPETFESDLYIPGYLKTQIGRYMRIDFLIGNNLTDRTGVLTKVGASYLLLRAQNGDMVICDLFAVKFITIVENP